MKRREFLKRAGFAVVAAPTVLSIAACGGGGGTSVPPQATPSAGDFTVTSTAVNGHTHDITVKAADLAAGTGVTYTSTVGGSIPHTHTVTLTPAIINDINAGKTDNVSSNPDSTGHTHDWPIKKP
jgi:predicted small lipoprotein YifL